MNQNVYEFLFNTRKLPNQYIIKLRSYRNITISSNDIFREYLLRHINLRQKITSSQNPPIILPRKINVVALYI